MAYDLFKIAHPCYVENLDVWCMIRDCYEGSKAVKDAGDRYLPKLKNQSSEDYDNYRRRALFFPITGKTASSMVGLATAKAPTATYPVGMEDFFVDTEASYQFTEFYTSVLMEVILMGRYGVLIDAPVTGSLDPKFVPYIAENIINWKFDDQGNLMWLLLREHKVVPDDKNVFESNTVCQYRYLHIENGTYVSEILNDDLEVQSKIVPLFNGRPINYIPFTCFGSTGVHLDVDKPPMGEVATINISHYMSSADLEWGRHFVGLPTPVVSGVDASTKLHIGGTQAWVLPMADAKAYYLEFLGQGLQSLEKALAEKISLMASVSARMVDSATRGSEAAETVRLRFMSESASIIHIIGAVETGFNILYNQMRTLMSLNGTVKVSFSREILGTPLTFKDLQVLFEAYFKGGLSKQTLLYNLKRLDAVDPNRTDDEELAAIRDPQPPTQPTPNAPAIQPQAS